MNGLSRRDVIMRMLGRSSPRQEPPVVVGEDADAVALILDRFCLAWQNSFCSVCIERCPVEGAIVSERGRPRIEPSLCTGCAVCRDVCPAPKKAVFLVSRAPRQGMVATGATTLHAS